jgi:hypothetical protein
MNECFSFYFFFFWLDWQSSSVDDSIHNVSNDGQIEQRSQQRHLSQKVEHHGEKISKQIDKAKKLDGKADKGPSKDDHQNDSSEKGDGSLELSLLKEKLGGFLKPNQQRDPHQKQQVTNRQQPSVKEEHHPEKQEETSKRREGDPNLLVV